MPTAEIGTYAWGSLLPRFSPLAPVQSKTVPIALADLMSGVGSWNSPAEFRRVVSLLHEGNAGKRPAPASTRRTLLGETERAELGELAGHALVAPARILARELQHEPARLAADRRAPWSASGVTENNVPRIYTMKADGSGLAPLPNVNRGSFPSWSPDGKRIAFVGAGDINPDIYVVNADGSNVVRLTDAPGNDLAPSWSPDAQKIAFSSHRDGNDEIYVMNADGSDQTRLTNYDNADLYPAWSPDGTKIAFDRDVVRNVNFGTEIWTMRPDGTDQISLGARELNGDFYPDWSPDGSKITFVSNVDSGAAALDLYVMNSDGTGRTRLTDDALIEELPAWSPDGTKIVFDRSDFNGTTFEIRTTNADGSNATTLTSTTNPPAQLDAPDWQPIPAPKRSDYKNAAQFCDADRAFFGDADFAKMYGTNGNASNAYGKCVSQNTSP